MGVIIFPVWPNPTYLVANNVSVRLQTDELQTTYGSNSALRTRPKCIMRQNLKEIRRESGYNGYDNFIIV